MRAKARASNHCGVEGSFGSRLFGRRDMRTLSHVRTHPQFQNLTVDRLCVRALVLAALGEDYADVIALARAVARSEERRAA